MRDALNTLNTLKPWLSFAGFVLVVAVLYWAQAVIIPVAIAMLLTFVLTPPVSWLQRWLGQRGAVLLVVTLVFTALGLIGWGIVHEMSGLARELPGYRHNIRQKIADVRSVSKGGSVERVQDALKDINSELARTDTPQGTTSRPVIVKSEQAQDLWGFPTWLGPFLEPLTTAGLIIVMVIFMLLERQDLRNRILGLFGHGHLAITTKAFEEAGTRVSRQLLMQTLVNVIYGVGVGIGLYVIGVPYSLLWAALAALLRFIPYIGPFIGAAAPILVSIAAMPGWHSSFWVMGLFLVFELLTNLVLEPMLYAESAGVSQVALLIAVAFWTWLWGPMGLLLSIPLTVCVVVLGKHVPGLELVGTLMADAPSLSREAGYYQRLLARDHMEALDLIDRYVKAERADTVYDALLLPALNYAERDRFEGRLSPEEEETIIEATRELIEDAGTLNRAKPPSAPTDEGDEAPPLPSTTHTVLGYPANSVADELALRMLNQLLEGTAATIDITSTHMLSSEILAAAQRSVSRVLCIIDLPPSAPSKTRYLVKKLRTAIPDLKIVVGRCAPPELQDENPQLLIQAGATHVTTTLLELREHLQQLVQLTPPIAPETDPEKDVPARVRSVAGVRAQVP